MKDTKNLNTLSLLGIAVLAVFFVSACKQPADDENNDDTNQEATVEQQEGSMEESEESDEAMEEENQQVAEETINTNTTPEPPVVVDDEPDDAMTGPTNVALSAMNNSGFSGTATIEPFGDRARVTITMANTPKGTTQPASIRLGSCGVVAGTKHVLNNALNGVSMTILSTSYEQLKSDAPLSIAVQKSTSESSNTIACGNLNL